MVGTPMRYHGSQAQILAKDPGRRNQVRIIPGDPSPKRGAQDDSCWKRDHGRGAVCVRADAAEA